MTCFCEIVVFTFDHERNWCSRSGPASALKPANEAVWNVEVASERALCLVEKGERMSEGRRKGKC